MRAVELLQYGLKPGTGRDFHKIMVEKSAPLHREAGIDIIAFGNSAHDVDAYYLIRSFDNMAHMEASQAAFYLSDEWKRGPREAIIERIQTCVKSVLILSETAINALRN
ncbi:NIPSNAP family protein [Pantoea stewartii]|uniref:NIPSNAP family protein n=1 Tax=Pantoea stewartii TaxID=66269 RepID=UPI001980C50C|nr:NIPSNAP family protein [Pantoea stewartii]